ncbi:hypothetical protein SOCE26_090150 [Sorangium cellulosum]|uniref:Secreted protein n=1 Tax=Sorangium cellulosum TaxID=56 RepID=A0A2L0F7C3_SORCE|nr:hypothetical protein [Sorangium cellulosum]AUX47494.1 hypothetical protein SOCE26_090150 [Sorangium cellulosum]
MLVHRSLSMVLPVLALACSAAQGAAEPLPESAAPQQGGAGAPAGSTGAKSFVDAGSYFTSADEIDAWYALLRALDDDLDAVCGDTFCEGEYSNYKPLRFRCSVEEHTGTIGSCVWVLAASNEEILPSTGDVEVDARIFLCEMPVAPETAVVDLVKALSAPLDRAIDAALPGTDVSLYDGLAGCL